MKQFFSFYDLETSDIKTDLCSISEFYGIRTDENFNIVNDAFQSIDIKEGLHLYGKRRPDCIASPHALATHGILKEPDSALSEYDLSEKIKKFFMPSSSNIICGYNNRSFDDEVIRHLLYRNLQDSYEHEYRNGNNRFDIYLLALMTYAMQPDALDYEFNNEGKPSLKLESLSRANGFKHSEAHRAYSDVEATISLAKEIKSNCPRLYSESMRLLQQHYTKSMLVVGQSESPQEIVHIDRYYGHQNAFTSVVLPMSVDPLNSKSFICLDLTRDLEPLIDMTPNEISQSFFSKATEVDYRPPIVKIATNQQPLITKVSNLTKERLDHNQIDFDTVKRNKELVLQNIKLKKILQESFLREMPEKKLVTQRLYGSGFVDNFDRKAMNAFSKAKDGKSGIITNKITDLISASKEKDRIFGLAVTCKMNNFIKDSYISKNIKTAEFIFYRDHLKSVIEDLETNNANEFSNDVVNAIKLQKKDIHDLLYKIEKVIESRPDITESNLYLQSIGIKEIAKINKAKAEIAIK